MFRRRGRVKGPEELPCKNCGCVDPVFDAVFLDMHFRMQSGKPFDEVAKCRRCGEEVFTMHFHGVGAAAAERLSTFVEGPGRTLGPSFAAVFGSKDWREI